VGSVDRKNAESRCAPFIKPRPALIQAIAPPVGGRGVTGSALGLIVDNNCIVARCPPRCSSDAVLAVLAVVTEVMPKREELKDERVLMAVTDHVRRVVKMQLDLLVSVPWRSQKTHEGSSKVFVIVVEVSEEYRTIVGTVPEFAVPKAALKGVP